MGQPRQKLQDLLLTITPKVYHQPPANDKMVYPCILYMRDAEDRKYAGNLPYSRTKRYQVTIMDRDPDSQIPEKVAQLPMCSFEQHFVADGLHHDVFSLYF